MLREGLNWWMSSVGAAGQGIANEAVVLALIVVFIECRSSGSCLQNKMVKIQLRHMTFLIASP